MQRVRRVAAAYGGIFSSRQIPQGRVVLYLQGVQTTISARSRRRYFTPQTKNNAEHSAQVAEYGRRYRAEHAEQERQRRRRYRLEHAEEIKERSRQYRIEHAERIVRQRHLHYLEHAERLKAVSRRYHSEHQEEANEYCHQYYIEHREKERERKRKYRTAHPDYDRARHARRRARKRSAGGTYTAEDVQRQYESQHGRCWWCMAALNGIYHVDHLVPLSKGGHNSPSNLVVACPSCNQKKHARMPDEFAGRLL